MVSNTERVSLFGEVITFHHISTKRAQKLIKHLHQHATINLGPRKAREGILYSGEFQQKEVKR